MKITLRPYQQDFIDAVRAQFRNGHKRVVGVAPCGAGKTIMTGWMIRAALRRGKRSVFFVHRKELIRQTSETFTRLGIEHGIIQTGCPMQLNLPVQIAAVQTLVKRLDNIPDADDTPDAPDDTPKYEPDQFSGKPVPTEDVPFDFDDLPI